MYVLRNNLIYISQCNIMFWMSQAGPMYGFGLPQYSQMIQLQQALSRQPFPWPPQSKSQTQQSNQDTIAHQMPTFQINQQHQSIPPLQTQHVTKQPFQLPPAPNSQTPPVSLENEVLFVKCIRKVYLSGEIKSLDFDCLVLDIFTYHLHII